MTASAPPTAATTLDLLRLRADDDHPGLAFEESVWSWREFVAAATQRAHLLLAERTPGRPFHIGVLLENVPEYLFLVAAGAMTGATVVGINHTRRGAELAEDIRSTDCQVVLTDSALAAHLDGLDIGATRVVQVDSAGYRAELARYAGADIPQVRAAEDPATTLLLLFTSGSTGRPKAVICSTGRFATIATNGHFGLGRDDVSYNSMPLFHGNALMACFANPLATGGTYALARRFSASAFLDDLLRFGATYLNYVGRTLSYVLAQPERPQERTTSLKVAFGTEASAHDRAEFERRFGVAPSENYGSSEGGLSLKRTPDTPPDALGLPPTGMVAAVLDPVTLQACPPAVFDEHRRLLNAEEAIGELANLGGAAGFEGYYKNSGAAAERVRGSAFLTGDLGYRDEQGFFYFAGRGGDRLRVDSENFSAAPIERILARYPGVHLVAVYPVPDTRTGDQVMATLQFPDRADFDPTTFAAFLAEQADLGTKWAPRYVRVVADVPVTATRKIDKPALRRAAWAVPDPIYVRPTADLAYRFLDAAERTELTRELAAAGRENLLR